MPIGKAYAPETWINPLISPREKERLLSLGEEMVREAQKFSGKVHVNLSLRRRAISRKLCGPSSGLSYRHPVALIRSPFYNGSFLLRWFMW